MTATNETTTAETMAGLLGGLGVDTASGGHPARVPGSTTAPPDQATFVYVWVVPVSIVCVSLIILGFCLLWFGCLGKKRGRRYRVQSCTNTRQHNESCHEAPKDGVSITPQKSYPASCNQVFRGSQVNVDFKPRLGKISESPEDRMAALRATGQAIESDYVFSPNDSMMSIFGKQRLEMSAVSGPPLPYFPNPAYVPYASASHPNLVWAAQAPFSPYRLTWISPSTMDPRVVRSDPNLMESSHAMHNFAQQVSISGSDGTSYYSNNPSTSWTNKSPYHPNYNTPRGSDSDSNADNNMIINRTRSWGQTPTTDSPAEATKEKTEPGSQIPTSMAPPNPFQNPSILRQPLPSTNQSGPMSDGASTHDLPGLWPSSIRLIPQNLSACDVARMGISEIPMWPVSMMHMSGYPPDASIAQSAALYARGIAPDMRHIRAVENPACEQCQACLISANNSMCPNVGSSNNSVSNYGCHMTSAYASNFSSCAHVDSYDAGPYGMNAHRSMRYPAPPYPGPSHSTSIAGPSNSYSQTQSTASYQCTDSAPVSSATSENGNEKQSAVLTQKADQSSSGSSTHDNSSYEPSKNSTSLTNQLSTTVHSTRSAPAAIGGTLMESQSESWGDSVPQTDYSKTDASSSSSGLNHAAEAGDSTTAVGVPSRLPSMNEINSTGASTTLSTSYYTPDVRGLTLPNVNQNDSNSSTHEMEVKFPSEDDIKNPGTNQERTTPASQERNSLNWDGYPFYTPMSVNSVPNSHHTTPESIPEYGPHLHLMHTVQPVLRDAQYWV